ncbi:spherulation-specific family 4 protein [Streptomyces sp. NPDC091377]|uniref:spherulation-specific family 4 protein n=1 Tax=Streptomyces sp. NPDC091377 TaxID=3365995 RepID=UPI0037FD8172
MSSLLVPYYEHPAVRPAEWAALLAAAPRLYAVVINPANGAGDHPDPAFAETAVRLRAAGVRVLGYADTDYGRRPHPEVVADLTRHRDWYAVDGAFLDQVPATPDAYPHYQRLASAAWSAGCGTLALNPGTPTHPCYARIADVLVTFEGPWSTYRTFPTHPGPPPGTHVCHLVYDVPPEADLTDDARRKGATLHCAVPGTGDHPWGTLPHTVRPPR